MKPESKIRFARVLIPVAFVIGVAAAVLGNIPTLVAMVLVMIGQATNAVAARREIERRQD